MAAPPTLDWRQRYNLLQHSAPGADLSEEEKHQWSVPSAAFHQDIAIPLMRISDKHTDDLRDVSKAQMYSREPRARLDTLEARKHLLSIHAVYKCWEPTPFLSFTDSPTEIKNLIWMRERAKRGGQWLTAINPNTRRDIRLPVLNARDEMVHYNVKDPYSKAYKYYDGQYLCLWEITDAEFVGRWDWGDLSQDGYDWYDNTVLPAFRKHEDVRLRQQAEWAASHAEEDDELAREYDSVDYVSTPSNDAGSSAGMDEVTNMVEALDFSPNNSSYGEPDDSSDEEGADSGGWGGYCFDDDEEANAFQENCNTMIEKSFEGF